MFLCLFPHFITGGFIFPALLGTACLRIQPWSVAISCLWKAMVGRWFISFWCPKAYFHFLCYFQGLSGSFKDLYVVKVLFRYYYLLSLYSRAVFFGSFESIGISCLGLQSVTFGKSFNQSLAAAAEGGWNSGGDAGGKGEVPVERVNILADL